MTGALPEVRRVGGFDARSLRQQLAGDLFDRPGVRAVRAPVAGDLDADLFGEYDPDAGLWVGCAALLSGPSALQEVLFCGVAPETRELSQVWVAESHRRRGLGTALVGAALAAADEADLELTLLCAGEWLERWYGSLGFARTTSRGKPFPARPYGGYDYVHMTRLRAGR